MLNGIPALYSRRRWEFLIPWGECKEQRVCILHEVADAKDALHPRQRVLTRKSTLWWDQPGWSRYEFKTYIRHTTLNITDFDRAGPCQIDTWPETVNKLAKAEMGTLTKILTSFWILMRISWDSHELLGFSWAFQKSHEPIWWAFILMRIKLFSWVSKNSWDFFMSFQWKLMRISHELPYTDPDKLVRKCEGKWKM